MQEQLISFETAKLAKEKGFNEDVLSYYNCNSKGEYYDGPFNTVFNIEQAPDNWNGRSYLTAVSAPTQSLLQRWLREKHQYHIQLHYDLSRGWEWRIFILNHVITGTILNKCIFNADLIYTTYEEALEQGLLEALKLIKTN